MIPTSFTLVNKKYDVEQLPDDLAKELGRHGDCNSSLARIRVELDNKQNSEHTFYHELVHAMLDASTKPKLSNKEDFVDSLAAVLHQYMQTKKGQLKKS